METYKHIHDPIRCYGLKVTRRIPDFRFSSLASSEDSFERRSAIRRMIRTRSVKNEARATDLHDISLISHPFHINHLVQKGLRLDKQS